MLTGDLIRRIRTIEIHSNRLATDQLAGHYHSAFKGRGVAFDEVRQYQPGDDVRSIDWNVSARMNDVFIKLFREEREMTVMLLVDMSASSFFGSYSQTKRTMAAEVAATMAFSAIRNQDRVGLLIFTDRVEKLVPAKKGKKHVLRVIAEILSYKPQHPRTNLVAALELLGRAQKRRSVVFLISDFLDPVAAAAGKRAGGRPSSSGRHQALKPAARLERALRVAARRHDLVPIIVSDPLEQDLPPLGLITLQDVESDESVTFDSSGPEAVWWRAEVDKRRAERRALLRRIELDAIELSTAEPYVGKLVAYFRRRELRLKH